MVKKQRNTNVYTHNCEKTDKSGGVDYIIIQWSQHFTKSTPKNKYALGLHCTGT